MQVSIIEGTSNTLITTLRISSWKTTYMLGCRSRVNEIVSYSTSSNRITEEVNILHHIHHYWRLRTEKHMVEQSEGASMLLHLVMPSPALPPWLNLLFAFNLRGSTIKGRSGGSQTHVQLPERTTWAAAAMITRLWNPLSTPPPSPLTVAQSLSCNTWNFSSFLSFQFHRHGSATHCADCRVNVTF